MLPVEYDYTPALLHLDRYKQPDSLGFNLVEEIPKLLYAKILSKDVAIWDSPEKKVQISVENFLQMEKSAKSPFVGSSDLFMHQLWRIYKHNFFFTTVGFSFSGETKQGRKITYGFVDAGDIISLLRGANIPNNANGTHYLSYWDALNSMRYSFNLVQFGKFDFKDNPSFSFQLKEQALSSPRIKRQLYRIGTDKEIEYRIINPEISSNTQNRAIYSSFNTFVNQNKQTILNAGGSDFLSHLTIANWKVDMVIVKERWSKYKNIPFQELLGIQLFINGKSVYLEKMDIDEMGIKINLQGCEEFLSEKGFTFILQRINSQEIMAQESEYYYKALLNKDWNKLTLNK